MILVIETAEPRISLANRTARAQNFKDVFLDQARSDAIKQNLGSIPGRGARVKSRFKSQPAARQTTCLARSLAAKGICRPDHRARVRGSDLAVVLRLALRPERTGGSADCVEDLTPEDVGHVIARVDVAHD